MPGTHNFQQFNPNGVNMESDAAYTADAQRSGGLTNPSIFTSVLGNKLFYQTSTFIAALATALANKGYSLSDTSLATLAGVLANVITTADLAGYAPLASPGLTGTPTAPTQAGTDSSTRLATTAFVKNLAYAPLASPALTGTPTAPTPNGSDNSTKLATTAFVKAQGFQATLGYTPVQQGGNSAGTILSNKIFLGYDGGGIRVQVDDNDGFGRFCMMNYFAQNYYNAYTGFQQLPSGTIFMWGQGSTSSGYTAGSPISVNFPTAFPHNCMSVVITHSNGGSTGDMPNYNISGVGSSGFTIYCNTSGQHALFYQAIGW